MNVLGQFIDPGFVERAAAAGGPEKWIEWPENARAHLDRRAPFSLAHRLQEHPLFQLDTLLDLAKRRPEWTPVRQGEVPVSENLERAYDNYPLGALGDVDLSRPGAYFVINNPEKDEQYRAMVEGVLAELLSHLGPIDGDATWYSSYIFVSSSRSVTPYHMDRELNFFFQIDGEKEVRLWDPDDDDVMHPEERDWLLSFNVDDRPPYRELIADRAQTYVLGPGQAVHQPFIAPHVVRTLSDRSISFALTYRTRTTDRWTLAHAVNHKMRRVGLKPAKVGRRPALDYVKARSLEFFRGARSQLGRLRGG